VSEYYRKLKNGFIVTEREIQIWLDIHPNVTKILRGYSEEIILIILGANFIQNAATLCAECGDDIAIYAAIAYIRMVAKLAKTSSRLCPL